MKAKLIKVIERNMKYSTPNGANKCYILCFKGEDGKPYRSWTDDRLGNFRRWYNLIVGFVGAQKRGKEVWLDGLIVRRSGEVDADSQFKIDVVNPVTTFFVPRHQDVMKTEFKRRDTD